MSSRGLALVSVLWVLTLLSLIAASFMNTTRTEINLARNQAEAARAEAIADAGVHFAILGLLTNDPDLEWRADGTLYAWRFADGEVRANVWDEGGKIDLNVAADSVLSSLFEAVGLDGREAAALVDAIVDFRDTNDLRQLNGAEDRDYRDAGLPYGAKDAPFETIDELRQVIGMTATLFDSVAPALTVYGRQRTPHEASAPPLVKTVLSGAVIEDVTEPRADDADAEPEPSDGGEADAPGSDLGARPQNLGGDAPLARSRVNIFTVHAEARTDSGAVYAREAVVEIGAAGDLPFQIWSWRQARRELFEIPEAAQ